MRSDTRYVAVCLLTMLTVFVFSIAGAVLASVLACVPGLHVYNVMAIVALGLHALADAGRAVPPQVIVPAFVGMTVGFAMLNTVPSVFLAAPDESALFTVLPGQKFLLAGRGYEGAMITAAGGLMGLLLLVLVVGPLAPRVVPLARAVVRPHQHWVLWCVICFMLMSEWPKGGMRGPAGWRRFFDGWISTGMGLVTFALSGLLGFILLYRSPISHTFAFQNLMPAFVGLFTLPWLVLNIVSHVDAPPQRIACSSALGGRELLKGTLAGGLGGAFAAFFPAVTGGVGGFLAGHATALRNDRAFLVSQGTSKLIYYVGGFLLMFVPGARLVRGGGAWLVRTLHVPGTWHDYHMALAATAIAGCTAFLLVGPLARVTIALIARCGYRRISWTALVLVVLLVLCLTGLTGVAVMLVASGIGLLPMLYGSRRMNGLGVILLPIACNMSGVGADVARALRLL